ncbi:MAG: alpha/beta fold hydrolase [Planctomycetota bacterium]|nr:alpha/beta fold hydrolase [Planctomycetota bacterium]
MAIQARQWLRRLAFFYLAYLILGSLLVRAVEHQYTFHPRSIDAERREELAQWKEHVIEFDHEGTHLAGWLLPGGGTPDAPLVVYYGGNAEELSRSIHTASRLNASHVLALNYRGFGDSEGRPTQDALVSDAIYVLNTLLPNLGKTLRDVVLIGRSIGTGVASQVAAQLPVGGVILVTPFDSVAAIFVKNTPLPGLPYRLILRSPFDSVAASKNIEMPTLILVAGKDRVIPATRSDPLVEAFGERAEVRYFEKSNHFNIHDHENYWTALNGFLAARH